MKGDDHPIFWENLGGKGPIPTAEEGGDDILGEIETKVHEKKLFKVSDASGTLRMSFHEKIWRFSSV